MKAMAEIDAGVCVFKTRAKASSEDDQHMVFEVTSDCENIRRLCGSRGTVQGDASGGSAGLGEGYQHKVDQGIGGSRNDLAG